MKSIGIIGGVGPYAGIVLHKKIIEHYNTKGIFQDCDFPLIQHISYPFKSTTTSGVVDFDLSQKEMLNAIEMFGEVSVVALACNSLLPSIPQKYKNLVLDPRFCLQQILKNQSVLILASHTSCEKEVYKDICPHIYYPSITLQNKINFVIEQVMKGIIDEDYFLDLINECRLQYPSLIFLLGCTELCVFKENAKTINIMDIIVKEIV